MIENFLAALRAATAETLERAADDQLINGWGVVLFENTDGTHCANGSLCVALGLPLVEADEEDEEDEPTDNYVGLDASAVAVAASMLLTGYTPPRHVTAGLLVPGHTGSWNDRWHNLRSADDPLWLRDRMLETAKGLRAVGS